MVPIRMLESSPSLTRISFLSYLSLELHPDVLRLHSQIKLETSSILRISVIQSINWNKSYAMEVNLKPTLHTFCQKVALFCIQKTTTLDTVMSSSSRHYPWFSMLKRPNHLFGNAIQPLTHIVFLENKRNKNFFTIISSTVAQRYNSKWSAS